jgi:hypothetical protein
MVRQSGIFHCFFLLLTILLLGISPAIAQQPPLTPASTTPDPKITASKDSKDDQATNEADGTVGKSKLEKETGTINDRIFDVLPNYGTVESAKALPPLRTGQKFRLATASVFDWAVYPFNGALAAISQAKNDPEAWDRDGAPMRNATVHRLPTTVSARI